MKSLISITKDTEPIDTLQSSFTLDVDSAEVDKSVEKHQTSFTSDNTVFDESMTLNDYSTIHISNNNESESKSEIFSKITPSETYGVGANKNVNLCKTSNLISIINIIIHTICRYILLRMS